MRAAWWGAIADLERASWASCRSDYAIFVRFEDCPANEDQPQLPEDVVIPLGIYTLVIVAAIAGAGLG